MTQEVTVKVRNLIRNPNDDDPYQTFKDQLLRMFALNNYAHAEAIANLPLTSNMQPSTLMYRMLGLLPSSLFLPSPFFNSWSQFSLPLVVPTRPLCVHVTDLMLRKLRSVVLPTPGREISCPAGGCVLPSCRCS